MFKLKRAYEKPEKGDGYRVLVERLWPRGVSKGEARLDEWMKEVAPSPELRQWFGHDPAKWAEFQKRYRQELKDKGDLIRQLKQKGEEETVTLVYGAKDEEHNAAVVLKGVLERGSRK
ncbi:MAG: DUF488 domain-containing protein [Bacillota bacterium]